MAQSGDFLHNGGIETSVALVAVLFGSKSDSTNLGRAAYRGCSCLLCLPYRPSPFCACGVFPHCLVLSPSCDGLLINSVRQRES